MEIKKYLTSVSILVAILLVMTIAINIFIYNLAYILGLIINILAILFIILITFSTIITYNVTKDKKISAKIMSINFKIVNILFPIITSIASTIGIKKNEIRKIYVKLNNSYVYSQKYDFKPEEILILIPHCIQKNSCKLKVTTNIKNCANCGKCNVGDLLQLKERLNVNVFVATGGTLARKIIIENKPKAVIAVACERDLTSGVQDVKKIPVLGVFNRRPNGPCVDTNIDIKEIEGAIKFFTK